jgi:hypothetical protein
VNAICIGARYLASLVATVCWKRYLATPPKTKRARIRAIWILEKLAEPFDGRFSLLLKTLAE